MVEKMDKCEACGNLHRSPIDCDYPALRALWGDLSEDEERFLRWIAGLDRWTKDHFVALARKGVSDA